MSFAGGSFRPDPAAALVPPVVEPLQCGPAHRAQYVIEFLGPRSIPASAASQLLTAQWFSALGQPEVYAMAPADKAWRPLSASGTGSYDSLAVCWDILSASGTIGAASGKHLLQVAEQFAASINRRAVPLPPPDDLDKAARTLERIRDGLDIGISLLVLPRSGDYLERDIWTVCSRLGLEFGRGGFEWRSANHPNPLFEVTPIGDVQTFSLGAVQAGARHGGVTLGFNVPLCPAPLAAIDGAVQAADFIARELGGSVFDEDGKPLDARTRDGIRRGLQTAVQTLEAAGIRPGSTVAVKVFEVNRRA